MATPNMKDREEKSAPFSGETHYATELRNKAKETAADVKDKASQAASTLTEKAQEAATAAGHAAGNVASFVGQQAENATAAVGTGMKSLAGTVRGNLPQSGPIGSASSAVADTLESGGRYLENHGLGDMGKDLARLVRNNPIPALLLGVGLGFMAGRMTSRS